MKQHLSLRLRPQWLPFSWRPITPPGGFQSLIQKRDWQLVLDSCNISFIIQRNHGFEHLYVSPIYERIARMELAAYGKENRHAPAQIKIWPVHAHYILAALFVLPLIGLHIMQSGNLASLPAEKNLNSLGCLDYIQVTIYGQWYRLVTALTLHAGLSHLTGNIAFGALFLSILGRLTGAGRAMLLTLLAGIGGNFLSLFVHTANYRSVGFSTALFGCVGVLAGIALMREKRRLFMPAAAALAILALLGTEGANTDYVAHLCGLATGLALGIFENLLIARKYPQLPQWLAALIAFALPVWAWVHALPH